MASGWSLDGQHLNPWTEDGLVPLVQFKQRFSSGEHTALLANSCRFNSLYRKNNFLAEGVHTVFGMKDGEAELQGFYFQANLFTPSEAKQWLGQRGFEPLVFTEATESRA